MKQLNETPTRYFSATRAVWWLLICYCLLAVFLGHGLSYNLLRSDVAWYYKDSLNWRVPFNSYHVPGYPLLIALFRALTFGKAHSILIMMGINVTALLVSCIAVYKLVLRQGSRRLAYVSALAFGLWPFVGLVYCVNPLAEVPAIALMLGGVLCLMSSRTIWAAVLFGAAMITHKALWPFIALLVLVYAHHERPKRFTAFVALALLLAPVLVLWLFGTLHHGSATWLFGSSVGLIVDLRDWAMFDGILWPLRKGGVANLFKAAVVAALTIGAVVTLVYHLVHRSPVRLYAITIALVCLGLFVFMDHVQIWAAVRFSRLLVLPIAWQLANMYSEKPVTIRPWVLRAMLVLLLLSQFAFATYMAKVVFA